MIRCKVFFSCIALPFLAILLLQITTNEYLTYPPRGRKRERETKRGSAKAIKKRTNKFHFLDKFFFLLFSAWFQSVAPDIMNTYYTFCLCQYAENVCFCISTICIWSKICFFLFRGINVIGAQCEMRGECKIFIFVVLFRVQKKKSHSRISTERHWRGEEGKNKQRIEQSQ